MLMFGTFVLYTNHSIGVVVDIDSRMLVLVYGSSL